jgi:hypothetical protein
VKHFYNNPTLNHYIHSQTISLLAPATSCRFSLLLLFKVAAISQKAQCDAGAQQHLLAGSRLENPANNSVCSRQGEQRRDSTPANNNIIINFLNSGTSKSDLRNQTMSWFLTSIV